ncbi:ankyrin repeat protein [Goatpox virus]|uniref:Ankyrin repeat protein n=1 Tax=Goatpox virus TaxID=186805 RepID=A0A5C0PSA9_9POXV|nr:ankyrin repeat protein [Goatpox virus]
MEKEKLCSEYDNDFTDYLFYRYCNPLFYYVEKDDINGVKRWIKFVNDCNDLYETPLFSCVEKDKVNVEILKFLIENVSDINFKTRDNNLSALGHYLSFNKNVEPEIVKILIDSGSSVTEEDENGKNLLHMYMCNFNVRINVIKLLIDSGVNFLQKDFDNNNILYSYILFHSDKKIFDYLTSLGIDIYETNTSGYNCNDLIKFRNLTFFGKQ